MHCDAHLSSVKWPAKLLFLIFFSNLSISVNVLKAIGKLPSVKRAFLRVKREIRGLKIYMPPRFWLPAEMSSNFARPVRSWGYHFNARVGENCCWWVCTCSTLAYFVVLQWTFRDFTLKWKKSQIFSFFLVGLRKLQETGWNWARTSSEKHQESNWVWGKKVREMVWERKITVDLKTVSPTDLGEFLRKFFAEVKIEKGQALTPSALTGVRAAFVAI